jgi:imidazolonepropionase-like amidohydrolase
MASLLIKDIRIFDGDKTIDSGSVLVEKGKIAKVSKDNIDFDGTTISRPGHTLLPGFIDAHIHADGASPVALPQSLRFGVTTACDMGNEDYSIVKLRKQLEGGDCADLKTTSFPATIDMGWPMPVILAFHDTPEVRAELDHYPKLDTLESGRKYVQDRVKEGVDYIKLMHESGTVMGQNYKKPTRELQTAVIEEAHKNGLKAVAHATCLADTLEILECGADGLVRISFHDALYFRVLCASNGQQVVLVL